MLGFSLYACVVLDAMSFQAVVDVLKYKRPYFSLACFCFFIFIAWNRLYVQTLAYFLAYGSQIDRHQTYLSRIAIIQPGTQSMLRTPPKRTKQSRI